MRDALDDRQAQPGAAGPAARVVQAREGTLQALGLDFGYAGAAVEHFDADLIVFISRENLDRLPRIPQGVVDQVADGAAHGEAREAQSRQLSMLEGDLAVESPVMV